MTTDTSVLLSAWAAFYTTTGTAAATLTGLVFVVVTLAASTDGFGSRDGMTAFTTPNVLHFGAALLASLVLGAPWKSLVAVGIAVGIIGLYGLLHIARVVLVARRMHRYDPDLEDWVFYSLVPFGAYALMLFGALSLTRAAHTALFAIAASVVVLIFLGIRNAWDIVTFIAVEEEAAP